MSRAIDFALGLKIRFLFLDVKGRVECIKHGDKENDDCNLFGEDGNPMAGNDTYLTGPGL